MFIQLASFKRELNLFRDFVFPRLLLSIFIHCLNYDIYDFGVFYPHFQQIFPSEQLECFNVHFMFFKSFNEVTEICVTPRGSECSQMIKEGVEEIPENFITVRANNCKEKNMTKSSDCKWENDLAISMDVTYRLKLVVFYQLSDNEH